MHVGGVAVFDPAMPPLDHARLTDLVRQRLPLVPRYRQRVRKVPGGIARPVWVDDPDFDLDYHVRRATLPRPGSEQQLHELVARLMARPLAADRPLWEVYLVEGLDTGQSVVVTKTHQAMVDGVSAVDLAEVMLDLTPKRRRMAAEVWSPRPEPNPVELVVDAVTDLVRRPTELVDTAKVALMDARATVTRLAGAAGGLFAAARTAARPAPDSPLNADIGESRRFAVARTDLDDYKAVRNFLGGTVNDVVLATIAGAMRVWLLSRGEPVRASTVVRTMLPVSLRGSRRRVGTYLVDLPVGEPSPAMRLHQISYLMKAHQEAGQAVGADALIRLSGFAPPTLHALGARAASGLSRRLFNLVVTNVPGPQRPLYAAGAPLSEVFPVVPLARGQAVALGVTSYNGRVFYGLNADRDAMDDVDTITSALSESLIELVEAR